MTERGPLGWPSWIGVVAEDLEAQRRFWGELLGIPESGSGPDYVEFHLDGRKFELLQRSNEPQYDRPRFQVGFAVDDVAAAREELIQRGAEPISEIIEADGNSWAYFRDPEGNVFEITSQA